MVILCTVAGNISDSANFGSVRRIQEGQRTANLRIVDRRAGAAWGDLEMRDLAIEEAIAAGVAAARNVDGHIEWCRGRDVYDLASQVAYGQECIRRNLPLKTQIPRLGVHGNDVGVAW